MTTPRTPSEWLPSFTPWAKLGTTLASPFAMLTQRLEDSARFQRGRQSAAKAKMTLLLATRERVISTTTAACVQMVRSLASIKTDVSRTNLQLTVCDACLDGQDVCLLDTDIDEHGELLAHTFDLMRHVFTGVTDPVDVHKSLRELFPTVTLGSGLEPRAPTGSVTVKVRGATR